LYLELLYSIIKKKEYAWSTISLNNIKLTLALFVAKLTSYAIKFFKFSGTILTGHIMLKFFPDFLNLINTKMDGKKITISGTNGKTTTSGLISHILENENKIVVNNLKGANLLVGITNSIAQAYSQNPIFLDKSPDYFVFETDEGHLQKLYNFIDCDYLVLTNLFNDQSDRFGNVENVANMIRNAISKNKSLKLVINADDPITSNLPTENPSIYYGIEEIEFHKQTTQNRNTSDFICPICGEKLTYTKIHYAQQGHFSCQCGYKRKNPDYSAKVKIYDNYTELYITHNNETKIFTIKSTELYNVYNNLSAITLALELGCQNIQNSLNNFKSIFGRSETKLIDNHKTTITLIKNPAGANAVVSSLDINSDILLAINDNTGDGHDISWLWDVNFESFKTIEGKLIITGSRAKDVLLRLKYAEIPLSKMELIENTQDAIDYIYQNSKGYIIILSNYTALYEIKKNKRFKKE